MAKYDSVAFDKSGKKHSVYIEDGKAYTPDGKRVSSGWTVHTKGGIYEMGTDSGFATDTHNLGNRMDVLDQLRQEFAGMQDKYSWSSDKDYSQLGRDMYQPIFDQQRQAYENQLNRTVSDMENQITGVDTQYDRNVDRSQKNTAHQQEMYGQQTLGRGLGRSTVATSGMAGIGVEGDRMVADINTDRANTINSIRSKIANVQESIGANISNLEANRGLMEQQYAMQLEDRDKDFWLKEAGLNKGTDDMFMQMYANALNQDFDDQREYSQYYTNLNRAMNELRGGSYEGILSDMLRNRDRKYQNEDFWLEKDLMNDYYTKLNDPSSQYYKNMQAKRDNEFNEALRYMNAGLSPNYSNQGGSGGRSYTPYQKNKSSYSSSRSGGGNDNAYNSASNVIGMAGEKPNYENLRATQGILQEAKGMVNKDQYSNLQNQYSNLYNKWDNRNNFVNSLYTNQNIRANPKTYKEEENLLNAYKNKIKPRW